MMAVLSIFEFFSKEMRPFFFTHLFKTYTNDNNIKKSNKYSNNNSLLLL